MPLWLIEFDGAAVEAQIAVSLKLAGEDAEPVGSLADLSEEEGGRIGRFAIEMPGAPTRVYPPAEHYAGSIVDKGATLILTYLPGLRGRLGETVVRASELTPEAWRRARRLLPSLPHLETQAAIDQWAAMLQAV